ncbi:MAG TPA: hypothetical protein VIV11_42190 [Kofleriaceae bacterium]
MSDSDITSTILRQIRDDVREVKNDLRTFGGEFRSFQEEVRGEFSIVHTLLRDAAGRSITLMRIINNKLEPAIVGLLKRVARLEKRVG